MLSENYGNEIFHISKHFTIEYMEMDTNEKNVLAAHTWEQQQQQILLKRHEIWTKAIRKWRENWDSLENGNEYHL